MVLTRSSIAKDSLQVAQAIAEALVLWVAALKEQSRAASVEEAPVMTPDGVHFSFLVVFFLFPWLVPLVYLQVGAACLACML